MTAIPSLPCWCLGPVRIFQGCGRKVARAFSSLPRDTAPAAYSSPSCIQEGPLTRSAATLRLDLAAVLPEYIREFVDAGHLRPYVTTLPPDLVNATCAADECFGSYLRACRL
jgi:hypothetical protein